MESINSGLSPPRKTNVSTVPAVILGDLTLVRPLVSAKIPFIVATDDPNAATLRSRHVQEFVLLPANAPERALDILILLATKLAAKHGVRPPLFYGSDLSLELIYHHRALLEKHFLLLLNQNGAAEALLYKDAFARFATARGVRIPRTLATTRDIDAELGSFQFPIVIKPKNKARWSELKKRFFGPDDKAIVFPNGRALLDHVAFRTCKPDLIVQEQIPGGEEQLFSFHGFASKNGTLLASFCGRKIRAFPAPTGESSCIELIVDREIERVGREIVRRLGLRGVFKIDLIRHPETGVIYTLEVNARFNLWHQLAAADGVNLPKIAYDHLVYGRLPNVPTYQPKHQWVDLYRDYKSFRERPTLGLARWLFSLLKRPAVFESFAWNDPGPAVFWLWRQLGTRFGRWRATAF